MAVTKLTTTVRLTPEAVARLDEQAKKRNITRSRMMELLARYGKVPDSVKII